MRHNSLPTPVSELSAPPRAVSLERYRLLLESRRIDRRKKKTIQMDSNSSDNCTASWKTEPDSDNETELVTASRDSRLIWDSKNTNKLIELFRRDCRELWDTKDPLYKDRNVRFNKNKYLADAFGTTIGEINRKIHNLRTQYNNQLRKRKRKQSGGREGKGSASGKKWEYFEALAFFQREPASDPLEAIDGVDLELAEFQANEEEEFESAAARGRLSAACSPGPPSQVKVPSRLAASGSPTRSPAGIFLRSPEEVVPRLRSGINPDECQVFGDFVASELRMLRSDELRKKLKRMVQKAILEVSEEDDANE